MKLITVLSVLFVVVYGVSEGFKKELHMKIAGFAATCISEVGANEADISELLSRKIPSTRQGKCLISCFQKKFGFQHADGQPDRERTMAILEPLHDDDPEMYTKVLQIAIKCGPEVEKMELTDHCDIAVEITSCAVREGKKYGLDDPFGLNRR